MLISLRQIGNSQGVVIPKPFLLEAGLVGCDSVDMGVEAGKIVIRPPAPDPRSGWAEAAQRLAATQDDAAAAQAPARQAKAGARR